ncbi:hypothetical protein JZ751_029026 [Albula glossodonta]|uniref:Uncharacterized protein n=1 Tax=Albula glossodonta TaxID=121402 RepID=A0A8T2P8Y1_9TELE|nr:hypothetical protein JZ751_029026 [Albula glossodonta]
MQRHRLAPCRPKELVRGSVFFVKVSASSAVDSVVLDSAAELIFVSLVLRVVVLGDATEV